MHVFKTYKIKAQDHTELGHRIQVVPKNVTRLTYSHARCFTLRSQKTPNMIKKLSGIIRGDDFLEGPPNLIKRFHKISQDY